MQSGGIREVDAQALLSNIAPRMTEFRLKQKGNGLTLRKHGLCPSKFGCQILIKD